MANREQIRTMVLQGEDQIQNTWVLWRCLSTQQQNLTRAARQVNAQDNAVTNAYLDSVATVYSTMLYGSQPEPAPSFAVVVAFWRIVLVATFQWLLSLVGVK